MTITITTITVTIMRMRMTMTMIIRMMTVMTLAAVRSAPAHEGVVTVCYASPVFWQVWKNNSSPNSSRSNNNNNNHNNNNNVLSAYGKLQWSRILSLYCEGLCNGTGRLACPKNCWLVGFQLLVLFRQQSTIRFAGTLLLLLLLTMVSVAHGCHSYTLCCTVFVVAVAAAIVVVAVIVSSLCCCVCWQCHWRFAHHSLHVFISIPPVQLLILLVFSCWFCFGNNQQHQQQQQQQQQQ